MICSFKILIISALLSSTLAKQGFGPGDQEWGYVTVRPKAHMFWWLYRTTADVASNYEEKPLIIWIQGGPGVSGTAFGNFKELGPLDTDLKPRNHTWVKDYNVLFIDNPVGTGFSYVDSIDALSTSNEQVAKDLMQCLKAFYKQFPKFSQTPTYILAESYGGKMTVEFSYLWYQEQTVGNIKSNFKGIGLVDSMISAGDMYKSVAPYLYYFGAIDDNGYKKINAEADRFVDLLAKGDWSKAVASASMIEYLMQTQTHGVDRLNIINKVKPMSVYEASQGGNILSINFIHAKKLKKVMWMVKNTLNLTSNWGVQDGNVNWALSEDMFKPVVHYVEKLLNETDIKVYVFNGQLDLIINTPGTLSWINKLNWQHSEKWSKAPKLPLVIDNVIEGYSKGYKNFKFYWVLRSGHMIPADNPVAMKPILRDLIDD